MSRVQMDRSGWRQRPSAAVSRLSGGPMRDDESSSGHACGMAGEDETAVRLHIGREQGEPTVRPGSAGVSIKCQSNCLKNHSHVRAMLLPVANAASYEEAVMATMHTCAVRSLRLANERVVPHDFGRILRPYLGRGIEGHNFWDSVQTEGISF